MCIVEEALRELRRGRPVLIYDWPDRESEVDMVYYAGDVGPEQIYKLRREAGGLICYGTSQRVVELLRLPLFSEMLESRGLKALLKTPRYGSRSNLVLWVNSIKVRTGISDFDRALTISSLHKVTESVCLGDVEGALRIIEEELYAPGHVPVFAAMSLEDRRGHTELAVSLACEAGLLPSVVYAEMLGFGNSMSLEEARSYAEREGLILLTGQEVLNHFERCRR